MRTDAVGNWMMDVSLPSGKKRLLHINICRPVLPVSCDCTAECSPDAGMCATEVVDNKVVWCAFVSFLTDSLKYIC